MHCFTSTETVGLLGTGAQDGHLGFHTAPELWTRRCFHVALRPRKRDDLLGTGTEWEGDDRVKARPRKPSEKDRRDRATCATAQLLFQLLCLDRFTKTMSVALLLTNNLDNSKQKRSNLLSPAPPPYS